MKIGILTHPLYYNYGGVLQAYALNAHLTKMGHEVWRVNRDYAKPMTLPGGPWPVRWARRVFSKYVEGKPYHTLEDLNRAKAAVAAFVERRIPLTTMHINNTKDMARLRQYGFGAYVVGSDQVWRPRYVKGILYNYFLDFCRDEPGLKRVAYAASFGVDDWEFTPQQTRRCAKLLAKFDAVSVREDSAVELCRRNLGRDDALHVIDPTLLLDAAHYTSLIEGVGPRGECLMSYVLDKSPEKTAAIAALSGKLGLETFSPMPKRMINRHNSRHLDECVFPGVEEWLDGFRRAKFVITDSFHGMVFAIIFNKPFAAIGNRGRGLTRFTSLLKLFGLEDRMVFDPADAEKLTDKTVDWQRVNALLEAEKLKAEKFLRDNLG